MTWLSYYWLRALNEIDFYTVVPPGEFVSIQSDMKMLYCDYIAA